MSNINIKGKQILILYNKYEYTEEVTSNLVSRTCKYK